MLSSYAIKMEIFLAIVLRTLKGRRKNLFYFNYCDIIFVMFSLSSIPIALVPCRCPSRLVTSEAELQINPRGHLVLGLIWKLFWIFGHGYIKFRADNICTIAMHKVNVKSFVIGVISEKYIFKLDWTEHVVNND